MFSLIITIISIALVAALALATLYYGGSAFNKGSADAEASKIMLQGQQLLGAADMYYAEKNVWPTLQQLLDGNYLKSVPTAAGAVSSAQASAIPWTMPIVGQPVFVLDSAVAPESCAAINLKGSLRKRGVLKQAYTQLNAQCYGTSAYKVVFKKFGTDTSLDGAPSVIAATDINTGAIPSSDSDPAWSLPPGGDWTRGAAPSLAFTPQELDFGEVSVFAPQQLLATLSNSGQASAVFPVPPSTGGNFDWDWQACVAAFGDATTQTINLAPQDSCAVAVTFSPQVAGVETQSLSMAYGDKTATLDATGLGNTDPPEIELGQTALTMPSIDDQGSTQSFQITNTGFAPAQGLSVQVLGTSLFGATLDCPASLAAGESCNVNVAFNPGNWQEGSGFVRVIGTNGVAYKSVSLYGSREPCPGGGTCNEFRIEGTDPYRYTRIAANAIPQIGMPGFCNWPGTVTNSYLKSWYTYDVTVYVNSYRGYQTCTDVALGYRVVSQAPPPPVAVPQTTYQYQAAPFSGAPSPWTTDPYEAMHYLVGKQIYCNKYGTVQEVSIVSPEHPLIYVRKKIKINDNTFETCEGYLQYRLTQ